MGGKGRGDIGAIMVLGSGGKGCEKAGGRSYIPRLMGVCGVIYVYGDFCL